MFFDFDLKTMPEIVNIYRVRRRTVWQIVDSSTLLIYASEGRCKITMDNSEYELTEGTLLIVPAGHHYIRRPIGDEFCTLCYAHIGIPYTLVEENEAPKLLAERKIAHDQAVISGEPPENPHRYICPLMLDLRDIKDEVAEIYNEAMRVKLENAPDCRTTEALCMIRLLLILASRTQDGITPRRDERAEPAQAVSLKLQNVFAYIRQHAKENITLDDLCQVCNFSKQHLIRIFNSEFGMPPKTYILNYRINCAKELFYRNPSLSVKEVADEMGFSDQHYFSRLFTNIAGLTPTDYKHHLVTFDPSKQ